MKSSELMKIIKKNELLQFKNNWYKVNEVLPKVGP